MAANRMFNNHNRGNETLAAAVTDVSERVTTLIREEIELAKAETVAKVSSLARGLIAIAIGSVFGVFALVVTLSAIAWGLDAILTSDAGNIWLGFAIVAAALLVLTGAAFLFAWRKLKVGAPTPKMAIAEAKKISDTVRNGKSELNGKSGLNGGPVPAVASTTQTTAVATPAQTTAVANSAQPTAAATPAEPKAAS